MRHSLEALTLAAEVTHPGLEVRPRQGGGGMYWSRVAEKAGGRHRNHDLSTELTTNVGKANTKGIETPSVLLPCVMFLWGCKFLPDSPCCLGLRVCTKPGGHVH